MTSYGMERPVDEHGNLDKAAAKRVVRDAASPVLAPLMSIMSISQYMILRISHGTLQCTSFCLFMEGAQ